LVGLAGFAPATFRLRLLNAKRPIKCEAKTQSLTKEG